LGGYLYNWKGVHGMEKIVPLKIKVRDIAIGFFGWIIFHNLSLFFYISDWRWCMKI
jgi:hypothetical protein